MVPTAGSQPSQQAIRSISISFVDFASALSSQQGQLEREKQFFWPASGAAAIAQSAMTSRIIKYWASQDHF
jgi:hypothetical protein